MKSAILTFVSIFVLITIFLIYLTVIHKMGLANVCLTQGLAIADCSITKSLINGSRDRLNY